MKIEAYPLAVERVGDQIRITQDWLDGNEADTITIPVEQGKMLIDFVSKAIHCADEKTES